jgi:large subunit ribosomal protein L35
MTPSTKTTTLRQETELPKLKTHKGAASRFRITGGGKIVRMYGSRNNMRRKKRQPVTVKFGRTVEVSPTHAPAIRRLLAGQK